MECIILFCYRHTSITLLGCSQEPFNKKAETNEAEQQPTSKSRKPQTQVE